MRALTSSVQRPAAMFSPARFTMPVSRVMNSAQPAPVLPSKGAPFTAAPSTAGTFSGRREGTTTSCPWATKSRARAEPTKPVPPRMIIRIPWLIRTIRSKGKGTAKTPGETLTSERFSPGPPSKDFYRGDSPGQMESSIPFPKQSGGAKLCAAPPLAWPVRGVGGNDSPRKKIFIPSRHPMAAMACGARRARGCPVQAAGGSPLRASSMVSRRVARARTRAGSSSGSCAGSSSRLMPRL